MAVPHGARRRSLALVASLLLLAGCTGGESTNDATLEPTSPAPLDAAAAFSRWLADGELTAAIRVRGTFTGVVKVALEGSGRIDGEDSQISMTLRSPTGRQAIETIDVGGTRFVKTADGPWVEQANASEDLDTAPSGTDVADLFSRLGGLRDLGVEDEAGERLHHLVPTGDFELLPSDLGVEERSAKRFEGTIGIFVRDDGTPVLFSMSAAWDQLVGEEWIPIEGRWDMSMNELSSPVTISPPEDPWTMFTSPRYPYMAAHPPDWEVRKDGPRDGFRSPAAQAILVSVQQLPPAATLDQLVAGEVQANLAEVGRRPDRDAATSLGGENARLLQYHVPASAETPALHILEVIAVHEQLGFGVVWVANAGEEDADEQLFRLFLATVQYTG